MLSVDVDTAGATVTLNTPASNAGSTFTVTAQFSEAVTGFVIGDITSVNGTISNFTAVDGDTYTFDVDAITTSSVSISIASNRAQDSNGNGNVASSTLTLNQPSSGGGSTPSAPSVRLETASSNVTGSYTVTVTFSEDVSGFVATDIEIMNGTIGSFTRVSGTTYTFVVTPVTDGLVTVKIPESIATSDRGIGNTASSTLSTIKTTPTAPTAPTIVPIPEPEDDTITDPLPAAPEEKKWSRADTFFYEFEDKDIISKLRNLHGEIVTDDAFENVCRTKKQVPYYRQCEFGFDLDTFE